ncbi:CRISPR-associated endoribonuclease Cas6 [Asaccharospora irregularis]|uniref:CRISPR-associated endoribonuclease Cas6 n=1 Tax=Asaccharospora irregularis DSM 2635 TaxID=1121321 RepID=A0A1M5RTC5_9FIRM|nr:CRISPR-associated endoribonuclease Cas6 [Asaccharospora irregularis]SHH29547.1 CRISPR-associated endoribonuclease Cas6 [Asaccharospora irregularis DSM 2635]
MRFSVEFETDKTPLHSNMQDVSIVKEAIKESNTELFNEMFLNKNHKDSRNKKHYCCARYVTNYEIKEDLINIKEGGKVILNFSSPDLEFMTDLYNGLMDKVIFNYKGFILKKKKIIMIKEKSIKGRRAVFKTLSPIAIRTKEGRFIDIEDSNYEEEMNYIINKILENYRGYGAKEYIRFKPINMKKKVIKEEIEDFKRITQKRFLYVNSYIGTFELSGDTEDLNLIYKLGVGHRRCQSFGMVDVIG